jgi:hypothetical protein
MRLVDYLYHTRHHELILRPGDSSLGRIFIQLRGFCDASYASHDDGRSQLAFSFDLVLCDQAGVSTDPGHELLPTGKFFNKSMISTSVDLSSCSSETSSLLATVKETICFRAILDELHFYQFMPTPIYNDNDSARQLSSKVSHRNKRVRYMMPKINFLLTEFNKGTFTPLRLSTDLLMVDINTKAVTGTDHLRKRRAMLGHPTELS